ncbi:glycerophosphodiester phosphodiesterase [Nocardioides sp. DS6]|uniref:Glycerophosphodiester phosphodiesterase n=1 Tax=Nocardioides eburneus TaxID=3231482 RepID=A0ABV3SW39_9ACTN
MAAKPVQPPAPVLVSAHRCGAGDDPQGENSLHALEHSVALGADFVEFDVRRRADGHLIVAHDLPDDGVQVLAYDALLESLDDRAGAHIDLKFGSPAELYDQLGACWEVEVVKRALKRLSPDRVVATTGRERAARALRDWADAEGVPLLVGLSIGSSLRGLAPRAAAASLLRQLAPEERLARSGANVLCANHGLALLRLRRVARRRGLRLLVWTVDAPALLRWWMRPGAAWMVTTNHPALALRDRRRARRCARRRTTDRMRP